MENKKQIKLYVLKPNREFIIGKVTNAKGESDLVEDAKMLVPRDAGEGKVVLMFEDYPIPKMFNLVEKNKPTRIGSGDWTQVYEEGELNTEFVNTYIQSVSNIEIVPANNNVIKLK
jgi:hypothetical protein